MQASRTTFVEGLLQQPCSAQADCQSKTGLLRCLQHSLWKAGAWHVVQPEPRTSVALVSPSTSPRQGAGSDSAELAAALNASGCAASRSCSSPCQVLRRLSLRR